MDYKSLLGKANRALVWTAGGGGDIINGILVVKYLKQYGINVDLAGMLSPGALHYYGNDQRSERNINEIETKSMYPVKRFLPYKHPIEISFVDNAICQITSELDIKNIEKVYNFSIRYGTEILKKNVEDLIIRRGYDMVALVDVGGDILAHAGLDLELMSPLMDFASLYVCSQLDLPVLLFEYGLGTDGETTDRRRIQILRELEEKDLLLGTEQFRAGDEEIEGFRNAHQIASKIRSGYAGKLVLDCIDKMDEFDKLVAEGIRKTPHRYVNFHSRFQVGMNQIYRKFRRILYRDTFGKMYVIDACGLAKLRYTSAFSFSNPLEQYVRLKSICPEWRTELDLQHLWNGSDWTSATKEGICLLLAVLPDNIDIEDRDFLLQKSLDHLSHNQCDMILMRRKDWQQTLIRPGSYFIGHTMLYNILGSNPFGNILEEMDKLEELVRKWEISG